MAEYTEEQQAIIFNELANSTLGLQKICMKHGISTPKFREFIIADKEAGNKYAHARSLQLENMEEQVNALGDELALALAGKAIDPDTGLIVVIEPQIASAHVSLCKVRIDALKWTMSKLAPKKYGDKLTLDGDSKPVNVSLSVEQARQIAKDLESEV